MTPTEQLLRDALEDLRHANYATPHERKCAIDIIDTAIAATSHQAGGDSWAGYKERCQHGVRWENNCRACSAAPLPAQPQGQGAEHIGYALIRKDGKEVEDFFPLSEKYEADDALTDLYPEGAAYLANIYAVPPSQAPEPAYRQTNFCPDCGKRQSGGIHTCSPQYAVEKADAAQQEATGVEFLIEDLGEVIDGLEAIDGIVVLSAVHQMVRRSEQRLRQIVSSLPSPAPQAAVPSERKCAQDIEAEIELAKHRAAVVVSDSEIDKLWQAAETEAMARFWGGEKELPHYVMTARIFVRALSRAAPVVAEWISVEDRLPTEGQTVLAFWTPPNPRKIHGGCYATATYSGSDNWHAPEDDEDTFATPTLWMPLPASPSAAQGEGT